MENVARALGTFQSHGGRSFDCRQSWADEGDGWDGRNELSGREWNCDWVVLAGKFSGQRELGVCGWGLVSGLRPDTPGLPDSRGRLSPHILVFPHGVIRSSALLCRSFCRLAGACRLRLLGGERRRGRSAE